MPRDTVALRLMDTVKVVVWMNIWNRYATSQTEVQHIASKYQILGLMFQHNAAFTSLTSVGNASTPMNVS